MQVITKNGDQIKRYSVATSPTVTGVGSLLGSFYQLGNGTVVYVPASAQSSAAGGHHDARRNRARHNDAACHPHTRREHHSRM